jgi:2,4-dienoyl-CoA reductase-like NADH-dependent reductase (Old Yellow Enzyme family)
MELVEGGVGLIISGHVGVHPNGRISAQQLFLHSDANIPKLAVLVKKVKKKNGKIVAQLNHGGTTSNLDLTGTYPISSSLSDKTNPNTREMTPRDIEEIKSAFGAAANRAKKAGFDGVQLHAAHGYLISQFLSPIYNKREDVYGGNVENRARLACEIYEEVRELVGDDYPVMIKMNVTDFLEGGTSTMDAIETASIFETMGIDAIELSGGVSWGWNTYGLDWSPCRTSYDNVYYLEVSRQLKQELETPLILTGGIKSLIVAEEIIESEDADYIGLCRPLLREPDLINRWRMGEKESSDCIYCSACLLIDGETVCTQLKRDYTFNNN